MRDMEKAPGHGIDFQTFAELFSARLGERDSREDIAKVKIFF